MMLQIDHRESHDVDIFLDDPQLLSFLDPAKHDFDFEIRPADHKGDGTHFLKLAFENVGEIDFIIASSLTDNPTIDATVEECQTRLETIPEIITKKIYHRGTAIKPRDIFDIAAGAEKHGTQIIKALCQYKSHVASALATIEKLNPNFIDGAIAELAIRPAYSIIACEARLRAKELLAAV